MGDAFSGPKFAALNERQRRYVELVIDVGLPKSVAAREAGYSDAPENTKAIDIAMKERREKHEVLFNVSRKQVLEGFQDSIDMARLAGEPAVMVMGWREVARLCGYYEPTKHKIEVNVTGNVTVKQLQNMSDSDLLKLASEPAALEGEYDKVADDPPG